MAVNVDVNFIQNPGLKPGDIVRVREKSEILKTLDQSGALEGMPFMTEMLRYCGQEFKVYKRADKTCDTVNRTGGRRLFDTVHLEDLRCDGSGHGGCEASCLLFWKEAWLQKESRDVGQLPLLSRVPSSLKKRYLSERNQCSEETLSNMSKRVEENGEGGEYIFYCQLTEIPKSTLPLKWWDPRQYFRELAGGNITLSDLLRGMVFSLYRKFVYFGRGYSLKIRLYNAIQSKSGRIPWPYKDGELDKTPVGQLDLQEGELVRVKSYDAILETLSKSNRNRGLRFDAEMVPYCGKEFRVRKRVKKIIEESTGKLIEFPTPSIILDGVVCLSCYSHTRMFCPRSIYPFWREIWLERVPNQTVSPTEMTDDRLGRNQS